MPFMYRGREEKVRLPGHMTRQDDGTPAIEGQKPIGEQPKMTNKTEDQCPNCGNNTLAVKIYDDGSGKVHCKRTNCGYEDGFYPAGENTRK